jgi:hypothetical protein
VELRAIESAGEPPQAAPASRASRAAHLPKLAHLPVQVGQVVHRLQVLRVQRQRAREGLQRGRVVRQRHARGAQVAQRVHVVGVHLRRRCCWCWCWCWCVGWWARDGGALRWFGVRTERHRGARLPRLQRRARTSSAACSVSRAACRSPRPKSAEPSILRARALVGLRMAASLRAAPAAAAAAAVGVRARRADDAPGLLSGTLPAFLLPAFLPPPGPPVVLARVHEHALRLQRHAEVDVHLGHQRGEAHLLCRLQAAGVGGARLLVVAQRVQHVAQPDRGGVGGCFLGCQQRVGAGAEVSGLAAGVLLTTGG